MGGSSPERPEGQKDDFLQRVSTTETYRELGELLMEHTRSSAKETAADNPKRAARMHEIGRRAVTLFRKNAQQARTKEELYRARSEVKNFFGPDKPLFEKEDTLVDRFFQFAEERIERGK